MNELEAGLDFHNGFAEAILRIPSARLWSPSDPYLYPLTVMLGEGENAADSYTLDVGVRTVEVRGDQLLLNGQPIKLTGFGKHEDFPIHGRGLNMPLLIRDFELLRWVGANAYRAAHYPHSEDEMSLADRLGVLIIDEIPVTELNFADSDELVARRLTQAEQQLGEMIARDKNHPSVILWCVGNEPMVGKPLGKGDPASSRGVEAGSRFFGQLYQQAHLLDATRPVMLVGVQGGPPVWLGICDVIGINRYYGWYSQPGQLQPTVQEL